MTSTLVTIPAFTKVFFKENNSIQEGEIFAMYFSFSQKINLDEAAPIIEALTIDSDNDLIFDKKLHQVFLTKSDLQASLKGEKNYSSLEDYKKAYFQLANKTISFQLLHLPLQKRVIFQTKDEDELIQNQGIITKIHFSISKISLEVSYDIETIFGTESMINHRDIISSY